MIVLSSWEAMADVGYALGEAEIVDLLGRNAPSLASAVMTVDNNAFARVYEIPFLQKNRYVLGFVILARDAEDLRYRMKTLKKIVKCAGGGLLTSEAGASGAYWRLRAFRAVARDIGWGAILRSLSGLAAIARGKIEGIDPRGYANLGARLYVGFVRNHMQMRGVFRFGGSFHTAMGSLVSWDNAIRSAKVDAQVKRKYIDDGVLFDDGADNAWGGLYEGGTFSHMEELLDTAGVGLRRTQIPPL